MPTTFQIRAWLTWWLDAVNEYSLHSPFYFEFYRTVIKPGPEPVTEFEHLRSKLINLKKEIEVLDAGAGSQVLKTNRRLIADIAKTSVTPVKYTSIYRRLLQFLEVREAVELGTSLGITSLYLASACKHLTTFEGDPELSTLATDTFSFAGITNIQLITGNLDQVLEPWLSERRQLDFAFLDANHTYEATLRYASAIFPKMHLKSCMVLDDIHWSPGMNQAWDELRNHPMVFGSMDLYRCGILFFDPSLNKQHVSLQV